MDMKTPKSKIFLLVSLVVLAVLPVLAQEKKPKYIIFAVLDAGQALEPIAQIEGGKLGEIPSGSSWQPFVTANYRPKTSYNLIFGGNVAGKVTVKSADAKAECSANVANVTTLSVKAKLKGMVMGLATNAPVRKAFSGLRRMPTAGERAEIEKLVRTEFTEQKIATGVLKNLRSHNLTALDVDNDGRAELVGSYWVAPSATERALLFFIAQKDKNGKYGFAHADYSLVKPDDVMSGEIETLDTGIYHELLLDVFDYDGDGTGEIFTVGQAFEGNNFYVYRREKGKWTKVLETYNYHCAY
jgi:hypothetical protein